MQGLRQLRIPSCRGGRRCSSSWGRLPICRDCLTGFGPNVSARGGKAASAGAAGLFSSEASSGLMEETLCNSKSACTEYAVADWTSRMRFAVAASSGLVWQVQAESGLWRNGVGPRQRAREGAGDGEGDGEARILSEAVMVVQAHVQVQVPRCCCIRFPCASTSLLLGRSKSHEPAPNLDSLTLTLSLRNDAGLYARALVPWICINRSWKKKSPFPISQRCSDGICICTLQ